MNKNKKRSKRHAVRKARRALNAHPETLTKISGSRTNVHGWSGGIAQSCLRERGVEDDA